VWIQEEKYLATFAVNLGLRETGGNEIGEEPQGLEASLRMNLSSN
jgi:hypothetical protein